MSDFEQIEKNEIPKYVEFIQFIHHYWNDPIIDKGLKDLVIQTCVVVAGRPTVTLDKQSNCNVTWSQHDVKLLKPQTSIIHIPSEMGGIFSPQFLPSPATQWLFLHPLHVTLSSRPLYGKQPVSSSTPSKSSKSDEQRIGYGKGKEIGEKSRQGKGKEVTLSSSQNDISSIPQVGSWNTFLLTIGCKDTIQIKSDGLCELSELLFAIEKMAESNIESAIRHAEYLLTTLDRMFQLYEGLIKKEDFSKIVQRWRWCPGVLKGKRILSNPSSLYRSDLNATNWNVRRYLL